MWDDFKDLVGESLEAYTQIETAKVRARLGATSQMQQAGLNTVPTYQNPQASAQSQATAAGGDSPWLLPLVVLGALGGAYLIARG